MLAGVTNRFAPLAVFPIATPPEGTVYQLIVFPTDVALILAEEPSQIDVGVAVTKEG